ncbi:MAG: hypothetical protein K9N55_13585 [Phycisphaerae bacterium]|nr:hypothetical protein [Phycisphaerae bacterium]
MTTRVPIVGCLILSLFVLCTSGLAVTSQVHRHSSESDLSDGESENLVIDSRGTLQLGRSAEVLVDDFDRVWSINSILANGSTIYFSTSPNGGIYRYSFGALTQIYPDEAARAKDRQDTADPNDKPDLDAVTNEHVFTLAIDMAGRLLAGFSGPECQLCRFSTSGMEVIFKPKDAAYIFSVALDSVGNIFVATGPQGKVYRLDPLGKTAQLVYTSRDKNILSLAAGPDGFVYAGSDDRGLVYKLNPRNQSATVLYDSEKPEVVALLFSNTPEIAKRDLFAIATSAQVVKVEQEFASNLPEPGRPESDANKESDSPEGQGGGLSLKVANREKEPPKRSPQAPRIAIRGAQPKTTSALYRITPEGYVTTITEKMAIFLSMAQHPEGVLIGTGNHAQLILVDPESEEQTMLYEDEQASQIAGLGVAGGEVFIGTANPAKLIRLRSEYAAQGTYVSDLIDAKQPAHWGKLQIDADIPAGCKVLVSSRSGNVSDVNDPTYSEWTEPVLITEPVQLTCPLGRFCQYKLILKSELGNETPLIREVAVASTIPNLAPVVQAVDVARQRTRTGKTDIYEISYKTRDDNEDTLTYTVDFRKLGRTSWIELVKDHEEDTFGWDSRTIEDGRYEVRVKASDRRSNTPDTAMTGSRVSDPVVIDNTGPQIDQVNLDAKNKRVTLTLTVKDQFTALKKLDYSVDGNADWLAGVPKDLVYDTTEEQFEIQVPDLDPGEHVITVRVMDDLDNVTYKSYDAEVTAR